MPSQDRGGSDVLAARGHDTPPGIHGHGHEHHHHHHHHDHHVRNGNAQQGEALRTLLGSILAPKRPSPSRSSSSSGTASPLPTLSFPHSQSYASTNASPSPQPPATPHHHHHHSFPYPYPHIQPYPHPHPHSHSHSHPSSHSPMHSKLGVDHHEPSAPSPLSNSNTPLPKSDSPQLFTPRPGRMSRRSSLSSSNLLHSHSAVTKTRSDPPTSRAAPQSPGVLPDVVVTVVSEDGSGTRTVTVPNMAGMDGPNRNKFLKTLEGKSAWDALIHGSFS